MSYVARPSNLSHDKNLWLSGLMGRVIFHFLNGAKKLVLKNEYTLVEYKHSDNDFYNCPIEALSLIASGELVRFRIQSKFSMT